MGRYQLCEYFDNIPSNMAALVLEASDTEITDALSFLRKLDKTKV